MRKRDKRVKWADNKVDPYFEDYKAFNSNSKNTYWAWQHMNGVPGDKSGTREFYTANPDQLSADDAIWKSSKGETKFQKLLKEAVDNLTTKQKKIWDLCMRSRAVSVRRAAKSLNISPSLAQRILGEAKNSVAKYLREYGDSIMRNDTTLPCPFCYAVFRGTAKREDIIYYHLMDEHNVSEKEALIYVENGKYPDELLKLPLSSEDRERWFTEKESENTNDNDEHWYDYKA